MSTIYFECNSDVNIYIYMYIYIYIYISFGSNSDLNCVSELYDRKICVNDISL
jgi:hypothetical protein